MALRRLLAENLRELRHIRRRRAEALRILLQFGIKARPRLVRFPFKERRPLRFIRINHMTRDNLNVIFLLKILIQITGGIRHDYIRSHRFPFLSPSCIFE